MGVYWFTAKRCGYCWRGGFHCPVEHAGARPLARCLEVVIKTREVHGAVHSGGGHLGADAASADDESTLGQGFKSSPRGGA